MSEDQESRARLTDAVVALATTVSQFREVVQDLRGLVQVVLVRLDALGVPHDPAE